MERPGTILLGTVNGLIVAFLLAPLLVIILFAVNDAPYIDFPPKGFTLHWIEHFLTSPDFMAALWVSVQLALIVVAIACTLGTMAAMGLVRGGLPGAGLLQAFFLSPLMVPAMLTGLAIFELFYLTDIGRNFWALVAAHVAITVPYVIRTVTAVLRNFDRSLEEAATNLGAGPLATFREVTLPIIRPGVIAGGLFAFIISFDQFEVSLFLVEPDHTTLPIFLFNYLRFNFDPTLAAASLVSLGLSVAVVLLIERLVGLQEYVKL